MVPHGLHLDILLHSKVDLKDVLRFGRFRTTFTLITSKNLSLKVVLRSPEGVKVVPQHDQSESGMFHSFSTP